LLSLILSKLKVELLPSVNFINVLRTNFSYKFFEKFVRKMLMELTPWIKSISATFYEQHFMTIFFCQKKLQTHPVRTEILAETTLVQKNVLIKCWWNWHFDAKKKIRRQKIWYNDYSKGKFVLNVLIQKMNKKSLSRGEKFNI